MSNLIDQSLGRYHILEQLGEGGMAVVYKAYDTRLETDVAVKVIRTERLAPEILEQSLKRFEREAKSLAKLTHPNIVKVTDYGEHDGQPYLVMPYLPGGTLKERLKAGRIQWQEAVQLLLPIAGALEFAHEQNLIHRDVKPSNILLTVKGQPMLTDFGIAKVFDLDTTAELTGTGMAIGTPEYMAPEQWMGKISPQTDVYALGIVFYEMVTGRKPYQADTPAALLLKQANDPLPRPRSFAADLPDAVEKVLFKALAKSLEDRYLGMGELVKALEGLLAGKPVKEARPARRVKEETLTAVDFEPDEKTQVDEKPIVRGKSTRRGWVWGGVAAGIVLLILAIALASKPSAFNLFPTATATASLTPLPTLTITPSGTPEPTLTPTETITPSPMPTPTTMVMNVPQTNVRISRANLNSLELLAAWDLPFRPLSVDILEDNQKIVFGGDDNQINGLVNLRNIQTGEEESLVIFPKNTAGYPGSQVSAVKFLPNGNIAILTMQRDTLFIYDQSGNQINQLSIQNYGDLTKALAVSPDGRLIAAGGCCEISIWDVESGTLVMSIAGPYSNTNPVLSLVFSKDGKSVFAKSPDGYVRIWDAQNGNLLKEMWGQAGYSFAFDISPTGDYLAFGTMRSENYQDPQYSGNIRVWRISAGQQVCANNDILDIGNGSSHQFQYDIEFSPDGSIVATLWSGWGTGGVAFYNSSNCALIKNIDGLSPSMMDLDFSPDGNLVVVAHQDGTIQFYGISR